MVSAVRKVTGLHHGHNKEEEEAKEGSRQDHISGSDRKRQPPSELLSRRCPPSLPTCR